MDLSTKFIITGLIFNTVASLIVLYPYINIKRNVNDDYILSMDKPGNYIQKKHIKDRCLGITGFSLFTIGFIFQIIGILLTK